LGIGVSIDAGALSPATEKSPQDAALAAAAAEARRRIAAARGRRIA